MEKTIKVKIDNKGKFRGTVGWLLANADHILIGQTKQDNQAAWLKDKDNKTVSVLAVRDWWDDGKIVIVDHYSYEGYTLCPDFLVSDACLEKLQELAEEAVEIMNEIWEENIDCTLKLTKEEPQHEM